MTITPKELADWQALLNGDYRCKEDMWDAMYDIFQAAPRLIARAQELAEWDVESSKLAQKHITERDQLRAESKRLREVNASFMLQLKSSRVNEQRLRDALDDIGSESCPASCRNTTGGWSRHQCHACDARAALEAKPAKEQGE